MAALTQFLIAGGAALLGGILSFAAAFRMHQIESARERKERQQRVVRLTGVLYEEVEQLAELLDIDLRMNPRPPLEVALAEPGEIARYWEKPGLAMERLKANRIVFDAYVGDLIELPGYLPNKLVRFHNRLNVHARQLAAAKSNNDPYQWNEIREQAYKEAEDVKFELNKAKKQLEKQAASP